MDTGLEDGEIVESDDDQGELVTSAVSVTVSAVANCNSLPSNSHVTVVTAKASINSELCRQQKIAVRLRRDSSESDTASSDECAPDSDSDDGPAEKRRSHGTAIVPSSFINSVSNRSNSLTMRNGTKLPKSYNIWGTVLEEQTLSKDLSGWFGINKKVESDRDVETYDYRNAKNDLRDDNLQNVSQSDNEMPVSQPDGDDAGAADVDICDRETFGTVTCKSSSKKHDEYPDELSDIKPRVSEDCRKKLKRKRRFGVVDQNVAKKPQNQLCTYDKNKDRSHIKVNLTDSADVIAEEIVRVLAEPDYMKETFVRIVETLGAVKALEFVYCTEDIEENGGLMTLDGCRRRTPGGVYLYLVKSDNTVTPEQTKVIFRDRTEVRKRQQKEAKQRRLNQRVVAMEAEIAETVGSQPLPDCKQVFLDSLWKSNPESQGLQVISSDGLVADLTDEGLDEDEVVNIELDFVN